MALIERLCQVDPDEERNIALNPFVEALFSVLGEYITVSQIKSFYNMTPEDEVELDALVGRITVYPNDSNTNQRDRSVHRVRSVLTFWEQGDVPGYMTVADVRSQFNSI